MLQFDGSMTMTGDIDMCGNRITNLKILDKPNDIVNKIHLLGNCTDLMNQEINKLKSAVEMTKSDQVTLLKYWDILIQVSKQKQIKWTT